MLTSRCVWMIEWQHPVGMGAGNVAKNVENKGFLARKKGQKHADICLPCFDSYGKRPDFWKNFRTEIFMELGLHLSVSKMVSDSL